MTAAAPGPLDGIRVVELVAWGIDDVGALIASGAALDATPTT